MEPELTFHREPSGMTDPSLGLVVPGRRLVPGMVIPVHIVGEYGEPGELVAEAEVTAIHDGHVTYTFRPAD